MKKILIFVFCFSIMLIATSVMVKAQDNCPPGLVCIPDPLDCDGHCDLLGIINKITNLLKIIAIPVATIMIIISGIQYLTSAGNEERATGARKTLLYTVIGLAVVLAVDFIVGIIQEILQKTTP